METPSRVRAIHSSLSNCVSKKNHSTYMLATIEREQRQSRSRSTESAEALLIQ